MTTREIEREIVALLKPHGVKSIGVFGSYARGEESPASDLDLLVSFEGRVSLMTLTLNESRISR